MRRCLGAWWVILWVMNVSIGLALGQERALETQGPIPLLPQEFQDIEELSLEQLLDMTITIAARREQPLEEAPGIVSVVHAEDIRRLGARTLAEVLRIVPGFEVLADNLGRDRIIVRGLPARGGENVLILFNGHRLNEAITGGATAINLDIPVDNLERIEIIRGPGSALFGTNAFAGVINLVPYTADSFEGVRVSAGGGSFATQQYNVLAGHSRGDWRLSGFVQYWDTNGAARTVEADAQTPQDRGIRRPASRAPGAVDDDRRSVDANLQLAYKGFTLNGRFKDEHSGGFIGFTDRLSDSRLENRQILFDASYRYALGERGSLLTKFSFTQNESQQVLELLPPGAATTAPSPDGILVDLDVNSRRFGGEVVLDYQLLAQHHLTLGISFAHESTFDLQARGNFEFRSGILRPLPSFQLLPSNLLRDRSRDIFSVFFQDIWTPFPKLDITLGVRYDHFSDFGDTIDPRTGVVWRFAKPFSLKLLYGSAFRAPSFLELGSQELPVLARIGNDELDPATLQTFEVALGYTHRNVRISADYFLTFVRDFIVLTPQFREGEGIITELSEFTNSQDIDIQGVEVDVQAHVRDHTMFLNYTYQHPTIKGTGERLADVPSHLLNLGVSVAIGPYVRLTPTLLIRGRRPRVEADSREDASAYALMNVTLLVRNIFKTLQLSGTVHNLFDTDYEDPAPIFTVPGDYPRPGRSVFIKVTYTF